MGIDIIYKGSLDDPTQLDAFIEDMQQRCERIGWRCDIEDMLVCGRVAVVRGGEDDFRRGLEDVNERIRGVTIWPPGTEAFILTFDQQGNMIYYQETCKAGTFSMAGRGNEVSDSDLDAYQITGGWYFGVEGGFIKTTGAVQSHVLIISFLRYIRHNYINDLTVRDPTGLWKTNDLAEFERAHREMVLMIGSVKLSLEEMGILKDKIKIIESIDPSFVRDTGLNSYRN